MDEKGCFRATYSGRSKGSLTLTGNPSGADEAIRTIVKHTRIRTFVLMIRDSVMEGIEWHNGIRTRLTGPTPTLRWDLQAFHGTDGELMFALSHRNSVCPSFWDHVCSLTEDEARELAAFLGYVLSDIRSNPGQDLHWTSEVMF